MSLTNYCFNHNIFNKIEYKYEKFRLLAFQHALAELCMKNGVEMGAFLGSPCCGCQRNSCYDFIRVSFNSAPRFTRSL